LECQSSLADDRRGTVASGRHPALADGDLRLGDRQPTDCANVGGRACGLGSCRRVTRRRRSEWRERSGSEVWPPIFLVVYPRKVGLHSDQPRRRTCLLSMGAATLRNGVWICRADSMVLLSEHSGPWTFDFRHPKRRLRSDVLERKTNASRAIHSESRSAYLALSILPCIFNPRPRRTHRSASPNRSPGAPAAASSLGCPTGRTGGTIPRDLLPSPGLAA
jgi:hypothetical protein